MDNKDRLTTDKSVTIYPSKIKFGKNKKDTRKKISFVDFKKNNYIKIDSYDWVSGLDKLHFSNVSSDFLLEENIIGILNVNKYNIKNLKFEYIDFTKLSKELVDALISLSNLENFTLIDCYFNTHRVLDDEYGYKKNLYNLFSTIKCKHLKFKIYIGDMYQSYYNADIITAALKINGSIISLAISNIGLNLPDLFMVPNMRTIKLSEIVISELIIHKITNFSYNKIKEIKLTGVLGQNIDCRLLVGLLEALPNVDNIKIEIDITYQYHILQYLCKKNLECIYLVGTNSIISKIENIKLLLEVIRKNNRLKKFGLKLFNMSRVLDNLLYEVSKLELLEIFCINHCYLSKVDTNSFFEFIKCKDELKTISVRKTLPLDDFCIFLQLLSNKVTIYDVDTDPYNRIMDKKVREFIIEVLSDNYNILNFNLKYEKSNPFFNKNENKEFISKIISFLIRNRSLRLESRFKKVKPIVHAIVN